jgi:hypothetical protein
VLFKVGNLLGMFVFGEDEVFAFEAVDGMAVVVLDDDVDDDQLGAGMEDLGAGGMLRWWWGGCLGGGGQGCGEVDGREEAGFVPHDGKVSRWKLTGSKTGVEGKKFRGWPKKRRIPFRNDNEEKQRQLQRKKQVPFEDDKQESKSKGPIR